MVREAIKTNETDVMRTLSPRKIAEAEEAVAEEAAGEHVGGEKTAEFEHELCFDVVGKLGQLGMTVRTMEFEIGRDDWRPICDVLLKASPQWNTQKFAKAAMKLRKIGILNTAMLEDMLAKESLNAELEKRGYAMFRPATIDALRVALGLPPLAVAPVEQLEFRGLLWACCPEWTASQIDRVQSKLAKVGIRDVHELTQALERGALNKGLVSHGCKALAGSTIKSLKRRFLGQPAKEELLDAKAHPALGNDQASDEALAIARDSEDEASLVVPDADAGDQVATYDQWYHTEDRFFVALLWESSPHWTPHDLVQVRTKLAMIGIDNVRSLTLALQRGVLNMRLTGCGYKGLSTSTISSLKQRVREHAMPDEEWETEGPAEWLLVAQHQLRKFLRDAVPEWSIDTILEATDRLAAVRIDSVGALLGALHQGTLNTRLKDAGLKMFKRATIRALVRHQVEFFEEDVDLVEFRDVLW